MTNGRVLLAGSGTPFSREAALALQEAGLLSCYLTGFYYDPDGRSRKALQLLPRRLRAAAERELLRRYRKGIRRSLVKTVPHLEVPLVAVQRIIGSGRAGDDVLRWRNERFDRVAARMIRAEQFDAVFAYYTCARQSFEAASRVGCIRVLEQSIGDLRSFTRIIEEERELSRDFADSLPKVPDWQDEGAAIEPHLANCVIGASEYVKATLVENGVAASKIAVIPYGADTERFKPLTRSADRVFRILFVGQIGQRKGVKYLLEATTKLALPNTEVILVGGVVGSGKGLARYADYFTHIPPVPGFEVHRHFQNADIFVFPSLHEGSAIAIYEALACGLPVITTPNSGSVVRDGVEGYIVPIRDVEALKERILLLYESRALRREMGLAARRRAEEFTWTHYRRRIGDLMHSLIGGNEGVSDKVTHSSDASSTITL